MPEDPQQNRIRDRSSGDEVVFAAVVSWECEHWKEMTAAWCTRNSQQLSSYYLPRLKGPSGVESCPTRPNNHCVGE